MKQISERELSEANELFCVLKRIYVDLPVLTLIDEWMYAERVDGAWELRLESALLGRIGREEFFVPFDPAEREHGSTIPEGTDRPLYELFGRYVGYAALPAEPLSTHTEPKSPPAEPAPPAPAPLAPKKPMGRRLLAVVQSSPIDEPAGCQVVELLTNCFLHREKNFTFRDFECEWSDYVSCDHGDMGAHTINTTGKTIVSHGKLIKLPDAVCTISHLVLWMEGKLDKLDCAPNDRLPYSLEGLVREFAPEILRSK